MERRHSQGLSIGALLLLVNVLQLHAQTPPEIPCEFRGAWVATVYNLDWPSKAGLPSARQQAELSGILDRAAILHLNAILLQVRPSSDALYESRIEPWSAFLSGKMGQPPSPLYDPLGWAIREAHARGLELHAWFNPFRALTTADASVDPSHVTRRHPEWIRRYAGQLILDPGVPAVREYVMSVIMDVVRRYDVDGIHIDDYFYPYPVKDKTGAIVPFPDNASWRGYLDGGGQLSQGDWRRENTNRFVEGTYRAIKAEKPFVKFGISPFGIWRPRVPPSIEARLDAYDQLYADSRRWIEQGWCDYFSPQLYWPTEPAAQSFPVLYAWWMGQNPLHRHIWPGIASERIGPARPAQGIAAQVELTRTLDGAALPDPGQTFWDMKSLMRDAGGIDSVLRDGPYREIAAVPASRWLGSDSPGKPVVTEHGEAIAWKAAPGIPPRWWAVQTKTAGAWRLRILPANTASLLPGGANTVSVRAIDRFGNQGPPAMLELRGSKNSVP